MLIEGMEIARLEANLRDEIRILTDERNKRLMALIGGKVTANELVNERSGRRLWRRRPRSLRKSLNIFAA
jgi:DNA-directed RNA polymerase subunit beta